MFSLSANTGLAASRANVAIEAAPVLIKRILDAPVARYLPGLDRIKVANDESYFSEILNVGAPKFGYFDNRRLHNALVVRAPRLQDALIAIPFPRYGKPGVRLRNDRAMQLRIAPSATAIA